MTLHQRLEDATEGTREPRATVRVHLTNPESGYESETNASVTAAEWNVIDRVLCGRGHEYVAAPDLLSVMRELFCDGPVGIALCGNPNMIDHLEERARAAIAKATTSPDTGEGG